MRIDFGCRWFDVSFSSKRERPDVTDDGPGMFVSNTASSTEQTFHGLPDGEPGIGYRSKLKVVK